MAVVTEMICEELEARGYANAVLDEESVERLVSGTREVSETGAENIGILVGDECTQGYEGHVYVMIFDADRQLSMSECEKANREVGFIFTTHEAE